ncbi:T9SS type B sorting domain-containing protein [Spirosoma rigui]|uniref:T9SS type B sorting domain-containing protein n=1 Tax=Spirosoma rigui TaxID=564064 RepID=UPI0009B15A80|nr:gliding motility-associated C-terminal domain-containing protein [Spirosoma rigui]
MASALDNPPTSGPLATRKQTNPAQYRARIQYIRQPMRSIRSILRMCLFGLTCGFSHASLGQVCLDLSKEPAVNQSFGQAGSSISLSGRTTYRASTDLCPVDGSYKVTDAVDGSCFMYSWHTIPEDHTPNDVRGNMMIVNASDAAGAFYTHPLTGLCSGTAYEFSVWGVNLLKPGICSDPVLPELTISIETEGGQIIQSINIGTIPQSSTPTWQRFSAVFTAPEQVEGVVVKLINQQGAGGCGNDIALDDIQLKQCGECRPTPVFAPEAFSPNNDGLNDDLVFHLRGANAFNLTIYNRWGKPVFTSNALDQRWDGSQAGAPCPAGDYSWVVNYQLTDATNVIRSYTKTGRVLLLR